jgi:hypothetical protein
LIPGITCKFGGLHQWVPRKIVTTGRALRATTHQGQAEYAGLILKLRGKSAKFADQIAADGEFPDTAWRLETRRSGSCHGAIQRNKITFDFVQRRRIGR